jgi:hypothetical protein
VVKRSRQVADDHIEANMTTKRISAKRFCEHFDEIFDEIQRAGCKYLITKNGRGHVKLLPIIVSQSAKVSSSVRKNKELMPRAY